MNSFFSSHFFKFNRLIALCVLGISAFSSAAIASPIRDLQNEITRQGISPEDVNEAMKTRFPQSDFPYYELANGCSNPANNTGSRFWNEVFKTACDNHDRCYATPLESQTTCDNRLQEEMLKICESRSASVCPSEARVIYRAVWAVGKLAYEEAQGQQASYLIDVYNWLSPLRVTTVQTNSFLNTGISIRSGDMIRIRASGTVRFGLFAGSGGPNGIISTLSATFNHFRFVPHGRLMARFYQPGMADLDGWFPVGVAKDQVVEISAPGVLEFLVTAD